MLIFNRFLSLVSADENASDWQLPVVVASIVIFVVAIAGFCYCCCKHVKKRSFDLPTTQVTVHPPSSTIQEVTVHPSSPTIQDRPWFQMLRQRQLAEWKKLLRKTRLNRRLSSVEEDCSVLGVIKQATSIKRGGQWTAVSSNVEILKDVVVLVDVVDLKAPNQETLTQQYTLNYWLRVVKLILLETNFVHCDRAKRRRRVVKELRQRPAIEFEGNLVG